MSQTRLQARPNPKFASLGSCAHARVLWVGLDIRTCHGWNCSTGGGSAAAHARAPSVSPFKVARQGVGRAARYTVGGAEQGGTHPCSRARCWTVGVVVALVAGTHSVGEVRHVVGVPVRTRATSRATMLSYSKVVNLLIRPPRSAYRVDQLPGPKLSLQGKHGLRGALLGRCDPIRPDHVDMLVALPLVARAAGS